MNQHTRVDRQPIPFIDVAAQRRRLGRAIDDAVARVLAHCQFIMGPEVRAFESELAAFCGARHAICCASGTDALVLVLMAREIGPGDAVICPSFTFCATAEMVALLGATPVIRRCRARRPSISIRRAVERAIATAKRLGLKPRAIIPVDLFGLPADHDAIAAIAEAAGLFVLDDAAQGFGATYQRPKARHARRTPTATSFFPAKPLGCYGDGGAVFTDDDALADTHAEPARARRGRRQIRHRAHRHHRPARHHPGGGADREAQDLSRTRSRRATRSRARYAQGARRCRRPCRASATARPRSGRNTRSGSSPAGATRLPPR